MRTRLRELERMCEPRQFPGLAQGAEQQGTAAEARTTNGVTEEQVHNVLLVQAASHFALTDQVALCTRKPPERCPLACRQTAGAGGACKRSKRPGIIKKSELVNPGT